MSPVPAEELAERRALGDRYQEQQQINEIDDLVRGIRASINILIRKEEALLEKKKGLQGVEGLGK